MWVWSMVSTILLRWSRASWARPFLPTSSSLTVLPWFSSSSILRRASRTMLVLNAPARPRSEVATISMWTWSLPVPASSRGDSGPTWTRDARLASTAAIRSE